MTNKGATKMKVKQMGKDDVGLEVGEGYVNVGLKMSMPVDGMMIDMVHIAELTPDKADELGKKLQQYASIARSLAPAPSQPEGAPHE